MNVKALVSNVLVQLNIRVKLVNMRCSICGKEGFREWKGLNLCVACYKVNLNGKASSKGKVVKRSVAQTKTHKFTENDTL